jgi:DNA-binding transcriptional LysR family regulator
MLVMVLEEGSFQKAAERLNVSASAISQNLKSLEKRLGFALLDRSSRVIKPTREGARFIAPAKVVLEAAELGFKSLSPDVMGISGNLIVSAPTMLSGGVLARITEDFLLANPHVQMELRFEKTLRHPIHDDVDLSIGFYPLTHKNLEQRELIGGGAGFYAAPDLAERVERTELQDVLTKIPLLMSYGFGSNEWARAFETVNPNSVSDVPHRMKCDDISIIYSMCLSGAGLAVLPHSLVGEDIKTGRLVRVLKSQNLEHTRFLAFWNRRSPNAPIVESFVDHTEEILSRRRRAAS